jgi:hypothetical protein
MIWAMRIRSVLSRVSHLLRELRDASPFFVFVAGLVVAGLIGWWGTRGGSLADAIRYSGTALTAFGVLQVAYGLDQTRSAFGKPTLTASAIAWGTRVLSSIRPRAQAIGAGTITLAPVVLGASVRVEPKAELRTLEDRVALLEKEIRNLRTEMTAEDDALRKDITSARRSFEEESARNRGQVAELGKRLEDLAVGGLVLGWIGLWWLLLGTVGVNLSAELAQAWASLV